VRTKDEEQTHADTHSMVGSNQSGGDDAAAAASFSFILCISRSIGDNPRKSLQCATPV
jgi:hypothetical protein